MADTKVQSLMRGRLLATALSVVGTACVAFGLSAENTQAATDMTNAIFAWVGSGLGLGAGVVAFISKFREAKS